MARNLRRSRAGVVTVAVTGLAVAAVAVSAAFKSGHVPWPAWATAGTCAVLALAAVAGKKPIEAIGSRLAEPIERLTRKSAVKDAAFAPAQRVDDSRNRIALDVHTAIPLPGKVDPSLSIDFPQYVARQIDADLRAWIKGHARTGGLVVLIGDAAAGKTRCLYEALHAEIPDWWMLFPDNGAQINVMVRERVDLSRTVLWLDEFQNFFTGDALAAGSVRQLVIGRLGPVLLAATIRAEELELLLAKTESSDEREAISRHHAREVLRMLARWSKPTGAMERAVRFHVDSHFDSDELARAEILATLDPRLRIALRDADSGNVTSTLAGAPELIDRWTLDTGDKYGQAIITAAITARRCGHPEPIPVVVLEALAVAQLAASANAPAAGDWLQAAIAWAESPVEGKITALRKIVTTPGIVDGYSVSDILLQHSYEQADHKVRQLLDDERTWILLLDYSAVTARIGIGDTAYAEGRGEAAERAFKLAAEGGDVRGMRGLGWLYTDRGKLEDARRQFQCAIDLGDTTAMLNLAMSLRRFGKFDDSLYWMRQAAEHGDSNAMVNLGFELQGTGQVQEAEVWYRRAANLDNALAMTNLGNLLFVRGDTVEAEHWERLGAALGHPGAMGNLGEILRNRGEFEEALEWYRKAANRAMSMVSENPRSYSPWPGEGSDEGVSDAGFGLAQLLSERGELAEAEEWFRRIAGLGDARSAAALRDIYDESGDSLLADEWRQKAAALADANLSRNKRELLAAYGGAAVLRHVLIIRDYADYLADQGDAGAADGWYMRASHHLASGGS